MANHFVIVWMTAAVCLVILTSANAGISLLDEPEVKGNLNKFSEKFFFVIK